MQNNSINPTVRTLRSASLYLISREREAALHDRQTYEGEMQCRADWDAYRILSHLADFLVQLQSTQHAITREQWEAGRQHERQMLARFAARYGKNKNQGDRMHLTTSFRGKHNGKLYETAR